MEPALTPNAWLRFDVVQRALDLIAPVSSVVEVGCGQGAVAHRLAARFEYRGYEPDPVSFAVARSRVGESSDLLNEPIPGKPDRTFDLLVAFEVLEHLEDDRAALESWRRWVRPGGHLLLSVPAHPHRFGPADRLAGHYRRYGRDGLERLLDSAEVEPVSTWCYGFPLGYALEAVRNLVAARRPDQSREDATAASGRFLQPSDRRAKLLDVGTLPFRALQRPFLGTDLGTGLVALGRNRG